MELNSISFSDFVKLAKVIWIRGAESVKNHMVDSGMVRVMDIDEHTGNTREFSEIDTNEYLRYKGQSDQAARGQVQQGYTATMTSYRVAENIGISYEMRTQNKYPEVISALMNGGKKGYNRMDLDLSHRLTFGTATSYTDMDGRTIDITTGASSTQQLFDTNHPLAGSSTTFRNRLANNPRLSTGSLEAMQRLVVEETYNHLGEKKTISHDILWTTDDPNTKNMARRILGSPADVDGAHSGILNVNKGELKHVVLPRVATTAAGAPDSDKRYYWGLAASQLSSFYLGIWERPHMGTPPAKFNWDVWTDVQTDDCEFPNRAGYGICVVGANWVKFSSGDGSA